MKHLLKKIRETINGRYVIDILPPMILALGILWVLEIITLVIAVIALIM